MPTQGQLILLMVSAAFLLAGGIASLLWRTQEGSAKWRMLRWCAVGGILSSLTVIAWHSLQQGKWQPVTDNFEALIWLAVLITGFVLYVQSVKPIIGLDWFLMPCAIALLASAGLVGKLDYRSYHPLVGNTWVWVHRVASYGGTAVFAIAAAGGAMYLLTARRLRHKKLSPMTGSLERLERIMMTAVTLGFALLTVGLATGIGVMVEGREHPPYAKLTLALSAWFVYAIVMHAPINPRLRGKRAAVLSMLGFILVVGTLVAVQFMPGGQG